MADWRAERDVLLLRLQSERSEKVRAEVAEALCDLALDVPAGDRGELTPAMVQLLNDPQVDLRCAGLALATELLPPAEAQELLERHLSGQEPRVRVEAVGRLADLRRPEARGALAAVLEDTSELVRFEAARGMAALQHPAGLEVLLDALDDSELRFRAAAALAQLGSPDAVPRLKKVFEKWLLPAFDRTQVAGALARLKDPDGIAWLFKRAGRSWSMDRAMAIELLGEVQAPGARDRLEAIVKDPKDDARGAAARALGRLKDPAAEAVLLEELERATDDELKLDLAEGLLRLGTPAGRAQLATLRFDAREAQEELHAMLEEPLRSDA